VYLTGGITVAFSAATLSTGSPTVVFDGATGGYLAVHSRGTAAAGKLLLYEAGADAAALDECANAADHSAAIVNYILIGQEV
jgi:hypothetical protein